MSRILPIAVFLSGEGTTFDAVAEAINGGHLPSRVVLVLSDRPHTAGIERARYRGLPTAVRPIHGTDPGQWTTGVDALLRDRGAELVVLAGFLSVLPAAFVARWNGRIVNVHPSLLPQYGGRGMYGLRVHQAVLESGDPETGASIHLVTDDVDRGPVLLSESVPVEPGDSAESLRDRVRPVERRLLIETIRKFADGEWALPFPPATAATMSRSARDPPR